MHAFRQTLERIDAVIYRVERALLLLMVFGMTFLVFLNVVQRTFTRQVGKTAQMMRAIADAVAGPLSDSTTKSIETFWGDAFFLAFAVFFCIAAVHAARMSRAEREQRNNASVDFAGSLGIGAGVFLVCAALVKVTVWAAPTGIPGAQKYALGMLVWAGLLGASIVTRTRGHIVLDAMKKKLDDDTLPWISAIGSVVTAGIAGFIAYLSAATTYEKFHEWSDSEFAIGRIHESTPIPEAFTYLALPVAFGLIALRFLMQGFSDLLWGPPVVKPTDITLDEPTIEPDEVVEPTAPAGMQFGREHHEPHSVASAEKGGAA